MDSILLLPPEGHRPVKMKYHLDYDSLSNFARPCARGQSYATEGWDDLRILTFPHGALLGALSRGTANWKQSRIPLCNTITKYTRLLQYVTILLVNVPPYNYDMSLKIDCLPSPTLCRGLILDWRQMFPVISISTGQKNPFRWIGSRGSPIGNLILRP